MGGKGYCATDVVDEMTSNISKQLKFQLLGKIDTMRFSILSLRTKSIDVSRKITDGQPLRLGTSNPCAAKKYLGDKALGLRVVRGAVEGLPWLYDDLDGVFEIVRTGRSVDENGLVEVETIAPIQLIEIKRKESIS